MRRLKRGKPFSLSAESLVHITCMLTAAFILAVFEQGLVIAEAHKLWALPDWFLGAWSVNLILALAFFGVCIRLTLAFSHILRLNRVASVASATLLLLIVACFFRWVDHIEHRNLPFPMLAAGGTALALVFLLHHVISQFTERISALRLTPDFAAALAVTLLLAALAFGGLYLAHLLYGMTTARSVVWIVAMLSPLLVYRLADSRRYVIPSPALRLLLIVIPVSLLALMFFWARQYPPTAQSLKDIQWVASSALVGLIAAGFWLSPRRYITNVLVPFTLLVTFISPVYAVFALPLPHFSFSSRENNKPRILLIVIDTLRQDAVGAFNPEATQTPHLDKLASRAIIYPNAYSTSTWTLPSVSSLITGLAARVHGMKKADSQLPDHLLTLAEAMQESGLATSAAVKNVFLSEKRGLARGFHSYYHFPVPLPEERLSYRLLTQLGRERFSLLNSTENLARFATNWMSIYRNRPFFYWLHIFDPHLPYDPPERFLPEEQPPPDMPLPHSRGVPSRHELTDEHKEWWRRLYLAEVQYVDDSLGGLFDALDEWGVKESMTIAVTSDHGEELWDHGGFEHGHSVYEEVVRVPLIIKPPYNDLPHKADQVVGLQNVGYMIMDLAGFPHPLQFPGGKNPGSEGTDFNETFPDSHYIAYTLYGEQKWALVFPPYKAQGVEGEQQISVFDLLQDPRETAPLSPLPADLLAKARNRLRYKDRVASATRSALAVFESQSIELSPSTQERLESLGYL